MADRTIIYANEITRSFDVLSGWVDTLKGLGFAVGDTLNGGIANFPIVVAGLVATQASPASMVINLSQGTIYGVNTLDPTAYGSLSSNALQLVLQGFLTASTLTLTATSLTPGQSQWVLVEATYLQEDEVRPGDPSGGVLPYYNTLNPAQPLPGPNGNNQVQPTVRLGTINIQTSYGQAATIGNSVPPGVDAGYVPLYLVQLVYGQTQIIQSQIQVSGPTAYGNYQQAPFLRGLINQHHLGITGSAPKIQLGNAQEVQGILPLNNLFASNVVGTLPTMRTGTVNPQGAIAGNQLDFWLNLTSNVMWVCVATGSSMTAQWSTVSGVAPPFPNSYLSGPIGIINPGVGIAVANNPTNGVGAPTVSAVNIPDSSLTGPLVTAIVPGSGITINDSSPNGVRTVTVSVNSTNPPGFSQSFGNPGWIKYPNGLIEQWADSGVQTCNPAATTNFTITLPTAFPTQGFSVMAQVFNVDLPQGNSGSLQIIQMGMINSSQAQVGLYNINNLSGTCQVRVWVKGY